MPIIWGSNGYRHICKLFYISISSNLVNIKYRPDKVHFTGVLLMDSKNNQIVYELSENCTSGLAEGVYPFKLQVMYYTSMRVYIIRHLYWRKRILHPAQGVCQLNITSYGQTRPKCSSMDKTSVSRFLTRIWKWIGGAVFFVFFFKK